MKYYMPIIKYNKDRCGYMSTENVVKRLQTITILSFTGYWDKYI